MSCPRHRRPTGPRVPARFGTPTARGAIALWALASLAGATGCSAEEAVPIDPANPPTTAPDLTDVTHSIEPTAEMREAAEQQCLDEPDLAEGYIRAVDPDGRVLAEVTVDCDEVRAEAG